MTTKNEEKTLERLKAELDWCVREEHRLSLIACPIQVYEIARKKTSAARRAYAVALKAAKEQGK